MYVKRTNGQVDNKQQQNNYYLPVKVFVETTLMILPDGASQNLRKFLCEKEITVLEIKVLMYVWSLSHNDEKRLTKSFGIVEGT